MSSEIIKIGPLSIKWYSVLILSAFMIGYTLVIKRCRKVGIGTANVIDMCINTIILSLIGARIYYCLFNLDYYAKYPLDIFKVWEGGLAIHGGIILGAIYLIYATKKRNINLLKFLDTIVPALALGQAIGRWGNFFNMEAFGPITTLKNLQDLHIPKFIIDGMYINGNYHHPTFLYESIGCLIIFIILLIIRNNKNIKNGQVTGIYLIGYGIIRFLIESLRQDSLMFFNLKVAQIVSIIMIIIGLIIIFVKPTIEKNIKKYNECK